MATTTRANFTISGSVIDENNQALPAVEIILLPTATTYTTNAKGQYEITSLPADDYQLIFSLQGYETQQKYISLQQSVELTITLQKLEVNLSEVVVAATEAESHSIRNLRAVEGTAIYAGKKTEVVLLNQLTFNVAANNARQLYAQIAGLNIYETNDAGLQLNIGGRGLDPNRSANFNTRQNGYDISADVLGYPESYYSPPAEALREIQVIRGAASLQYGTQFGGLVNFKFKRPHPLKKAEIITRQTVGSNALFTSFNSLSGTVGKFSYYTYFNYKKGNDFRPNSGFDSKNVFAQIRYQLAPRTQIRLEGTYLNYLAQQAGGLTDAQFLENPVFSNRTRNWFAVDWRLWALQLKHKLSPSADFSLQFFGLHAQRNAVGFRTNRVSQTDDVTAPRDLIKGDFRNWGFETRYLKRYQLARRNAIFLVGSKLYQSNNKAQQGAGSADATADFSLCNDAFPFYPNQSDFVFPNFNWAVFGEHIYYISDQLSITPGVRYEYIRTESKGTFRAIDFDLAQNPIRDTLLQDVRRFERQKILFGLGLSYKPSLQKEWYGNFSQNYRSVTFNDIRTVNPSFQVDPSITDENGFSTDWGIRGNYKQLRFDANVFGLLYNDRLGEVLRAQTRTNAAGETIETGRIIRYRGNIGQAFIYGIESLLDWNILEPNVEKKKLVKLNVFTNIAITHSTYLQSEIAGITGNEVEFIPRFNIKSGVGFGYKNLLGSVQHTYLSSQFTDASNAPQNVNDNQQGIIGSIPAYQILDVALSYRFKWFKIETGANNLLNRYYFTRRATGYPGPGVIPSAPRTIYATLEVKF